MADAGWYPDPQDPNAEQYWDGGSWTGQRRAAGSGGAVPAAGHDDDAQRTRINPVFGGTPAAEPPAPPAAEPASGHGYGPQGYEQGSAQPGYGHPGYRQPTYGQPGWGQPDAAPAGAPQVYGAFVTPDAHPASRGYPAQGGYPAQDSYPQQGGYPAAGGYGPPGPPGAYGTPGYGATPVGPSTARPPRRRVLIAAGAAVVLVAAGLVTWLVLPGDDAPSLTYQGKAVSKPADVLTTAEGSVARTVSERHGAKSADTRCYFVQADKPADGAKKSDVQPSLLCGPVLFVDGNTAQEYLPVPFTADTSSGKAVLTPQSSLDGLDPSSVRSGFTLVRPDGKKAPDGNGGLAVPAPPPATKDSVVATTLGPTPEPAVVAGAVMVGRTRKVTVDHAGFITRYGSGTDARSAPSGQKLLAFDLAYDDGDIGSGDSARVTLQVDGTSHDIPDTTTGQYVVAAVPATGAVTVQLVDSGDTQTLALPAGTPGATNIAVLRRTNRAQVFDKSFAVPVVGRKGGNSADTSWRTTATGALLDYWPPANDAIKPTSPADAFLSIRMNYTDAANPGGPYGYDARLLTLRLPGGAVVKARNIAPAGKVADVFEVPATFTTGTIVISGSYPIGDGVTVQVRTPMTVPVSIPAG